MRPAPELSGSGAFCMPDLRACGSAYLPGAGLTYEYGFGGEDAVLPSLCRGLQGRDIAAAYPAGRTRKQVFNIKVTKKDKK